MKNTVIKGDGTSRKLKAPSSLPESFSEWRTQLLAGNATLDIALNPDGCETVGTPLSKSNLLTDETKTALGLTSDDPTINEALNLLGNAQPVIAATPPTTSTVGIVGQEYIDTAAKLVYKCTAAGDTGYTWEVYSAGRSTKVNTTLSASGWSTAKKYTVSNANITATSPVELLPRENSGITQAQMEALSGAMIVGGTQAAGSIQLVALGDVPTIDIPVTLIIRRDL